MQDKIVTLVKYRYPYRAEILKTRLQEEGIDCIVTTESAFSLVDGVKVLVLKKDFERALKVYRQVRELYDTHSKDVIEDADDDSDLPEDFDEADFEDEDK